MTVKSSYYAKPDPAEKAPVRRRRRTKADLANLGVEETVGDDDMPYDSDVTRERMNELRSNEFLYLLRKHHGS